MSLVGVLVYAIFILLPRDYRTSVAWLWLRNQVPPRLSGRTRSPPCPSTGDPAQGHVEIGSGGTILSARHASGRTDGRASVANCLAGRAILFLCYNEAELRTT